METIKEQHLDIFPEIQKVVTTVQQTYIINKVQTSQNIFLCFNMKQPIDVINIKTMNAMNYLQLKGASYAKIL